MFHFKKFSIDDSRAAMKIGTDAVLLGAWVPCENETHRLDIGTGCGILAIMMAQRNDRVPIDAVEIDKNASLLAEQNFKLSPWGEQLSLYHASIQDFLLNTSHKYSLILSNPPFFTDSLKAPDMARTLARHNHAMPVRELLEITSKLLTETGKAAFIIPFDAYSNWISQASDFSLYPALAAIVKSSAKHAAHRMMVVFTRKKSREPINNEIIIYSSTNIYTSQYRDLTKEFYVNF